RDAARCAVQNDATALQPGRTHRPELHDGSHAERELKFVLLRAREKIVLAEAALDGATNRMGLNHDPGTNALRQVHLATGLVEEDLAVVHDVVERGHGLAARRKPRYLEGVARKKRSHRVVVELRVLLRFEHAAPPVGAPAFLMKRAQDLLRGRELRRSTSDGP